MDAFSLKWKHLFANAFPPFRMVPQVLNKIRNVYCTIILIAPMWPQRSWFNNLLELVTASPIQLPCKEDLLSQAHDTVFHPNIEMPRLHVWRLSGNQFETEFSEYATFCISNAKRESTNKVYSLKWKKFCHWCSEREVNPVDPPIHVIADFLSTFFEKKMYQFLRSKAADWPFRTR